MPHGRSSRGVCVGAFLSWERGSKAVGFGDVLTCPSLSLGIGAGTPRWGCWWNSFPEMDPPGFPLRGVDG